MGNSKTFFSSTKQFLYIGLFSFLLILFSFYRSYNIEKETQYNFALIEAKNSFAKDIIYRKWAALEGGLYVPVTEFTPPNPYLNVPYRDVETKEGLKLTLVNPAYMTRMVHGLEKQRDGVVSHITSLNPINPYNKPDKWEEAALKEIEKGIEEKHDLQLLNNKKYLRYISAFKVEEPCLKCHAQQGYKVGDVRGGISVSIPFSEYEQMLSKNILNLFLSHSGAAIITFIVLFVGASSTYRKNKKLINREHQITEIVNNSDIGYWEFDVANNKLIINKEWCEKVGYEFPESGNKIEFYIARVHEEDASKSLQILDDLRNGRISEFSLEHRIKCKDGNFKWMLSKGKVIESKKGIPLKMSGVQIDIDKDKKMVENILKHSKEFDLIFDYSPLPTSISSLEDGKYLAVNKAWEALSGYSNSEVVGKTSIELGLWKNSSDRQNFVQNISQNGFVNGLELEFYNKQKQTIPARVSASIVEIDNKKFIVAVLKDISKEKQFERKLKKEKELYSYFNYIHLLIDEIDERNFYDLSIEYLVKLTDSKIGFFHAVSEDQKEVILTTWSQKAKEFCSAEYKSHYPINEAGNWIDCLKTKRAVIYNDYKNSPNQKGLPVGHVQVEKFMSIATYINDKPYLIFGVGNKEEDYDDNDARNIELFASELSKLIEKKNFINKIKENERFISSIINNLPGFVYRCANDKNWTMYYLSENTINFIGYKEDELINNQVLSYNDLILPQFQQMIWDKIQEALEKNSPYEFEYQIVKKDGSIIWVWERGRGVKDKNGNLLFLEGFITDIDQKKKLELDLIKSEEKYRLIAENTGDVIYVFDMDLNYIFISPSVKNILGYEPEELYKIGVKKVMVPQYLEQLMAVYSEEMEKEKAAVFDPKRTINFVSQQYRKDGKIVWMESTLSFLRDENGKPNAILSISRNISARKKLENELKESEEKFRNLFEQHTATKLLIDTERGKIIDANEAAQLFYGYTLEELQTKTLFDICKCPEIRKSEMLESLTLRTKDHLEQTHILSNGKTVDVEIFPSSVRMGKKEFLHLIIIDITEKKKLQKVLIDNEKKYRLLVEEMYQGLAVHQAIYDKNGNMVDYKFIDMNKSFENMLGIKKEDLLNKTVLEVMPETEKYWIETYEKVVKTGEPIEYENYSKEFDKYFHVIAYNNQPDQFATIVTDITQQKKLQMRIEESEKRFRRIVDSSQDIIFELNMLPELKYVFISDSVTKVMGYTPEEFYEDAKLAERLIHPDDFNSFIENIYSGKKDKISFTIRHKSKSGDIKWIEHNIMPTYNDVDKLIKLEGILRDITLKKEYEIIIVESEAKYRRLFESMTAGFILFEIITNENKEPVDLLIVAANEVFANVTGLTLSNAVGKKLTEVLPGIEKDHAGWIHKYSKVAFTGQHLTFEEYSDLLQKYFTVSAFQPEQNRCAVTFIDITEKKLAEQELRRQKQRLEDIINSTESATWEWNIQTGEIIVNDQWAEMLGFTLEEIKPNTIKVWDSLCHPDDLKRSYDLINKHIKGELDSYECECRIKTKTGQWKWVLDRGKIFSFTKDGKPEWMFGSHLDITERKKREAELVYKNRLITIKNQLSEILLKDENTERAINQVLKKITEESKQDRAYVFEYHKDKQGNILISQRFEYSVNSVTPQINNPELQNLPVENTIKRWYDNFLNNKIIEGNVKDFPKEEREILQSQDIVSIIVVPIFINEKLWGFIGLDNCREEFNWTDFERELLYSAGLTIGNAYLRKRSQDLIKANEQRLSALINSTPDLIYFKDGEGRWLIANNSVLKLLGLEGKNYFGKTSNDLSKMVSPELTNLLKNSYKTDEEAWQRKEILNILTEIKTDNKKRYFDVLKVPMFEENGDRKGLVVFARDVTELKEKQDELKTLSRVIEQSPVSVVITDTSGKIVFVNRYFSEVTGYSAEEVIGQNPRILSAGKHSKAFYENMWRTISSGNSWEGMFYNQKKNGTKFWESAIISPIRDENNQIIFYVAVKEDVTEDLMKEEQLQNYREKLEKLVEERTRELQNVNEELVEQIKKERELEAQLQEALLKEKDINELKVRFFASVSHEFRTPLAGILTSAQMIQRYGKKWSEEKILDHFRNIEKTVVQLTKLLDDILLISKADREILKNDPREENIGELFKNIIEQHYSTIQKGRKINFTNNCPSISYSVDPKLLNHIVGNLLSNAIKFSFEGTDVNLTLEESNKQLVIKVRDKGIGIPEEEIKKIFEPFYRTSNSASFKGTGLGLNIVKRCVEILKGKIEVESKVNEGTTFTVRIPIYDK